MNKTLLLVLLVVTSGVASADLNTDNFVDDSSVIDNIVAWAQGLGERISNAISSDDWSATAEAESVKTFFNDRAGQFQQYVNDRSDASTSLDVIEITFKNGSDTSTVYLVGDVNGSNYENVSIVSSTDRTPDEWVVLCESAGENAKEELEHFFDEYVSEDKNITEAYERRIAGEYGGQFTSSMLSGEECDA